MPSLGLAHPRSRFRFDRLTAAALARIARFPSYRAPRAADLHDPTTFQPPAGPHGGQSLTGRAFISAGSVETAVRLVAVQPFLRELAASPHLARLRRLDLTGNCIGVDGARALAASPYLGGLRELGLNANAIGSEGAAALMAAPWLAGLTRLEMADNGLTADDVARVLAAAPRLEAVDVSGNAVGDVAGLLRRFRHVCAAKVGWGDATLPSCTPNANSRGAYATPLASLNLRHNRIDVVTLMERGPFPALARLDIGFNDIGDAVLTASDLPALRTLGLRANRLTAPALDSSTVEDLDLSVNPLTDHAAVVAGFPNVVRLNLSNTTLTDNGIRSLLSVLPPGLRSLKLAWNPLGDAAALALAEWPGLAALDSLDLSGTRIGRRGARALGGRFGTIPA